MFEWVDYVITNEVVLQSTEEVEAQVEKNNGGGSIWSKINDSEFNINQKLFI